MISKGDIVNLALRKLHGGREATNTGIEPGEMSDALQDLEAMLAQWQMDGYDLCYNFSCDCGGSPAELEDSSLLLWMKLPVACNLALLLAPDFGVQPSPELRAEAANGWRTLVRHFSKNCTRKTSGLLPLGQGNIRTGIIVRRGNPKAGDKFG